MAENYRVRPKVSVIIPIYGVENYIGRCARSLLNQTMQKDVELIFINDASEDKSIDILKSVIDEHQCYPGVIEIISHDVNKGLPSSRNTGLDAAKGEYVIHVDGDDYAEPGMLELLYKAVSERDADFAWCDYYITFSENKRIIKQPNVQTPDDAVRCMLRGSMKYNVWNKICRRQLYIDNDIRFPDGNAMGEDLTMILVALHAKNCIYVQKSLYNYVQNPNQMTSEYNEKKLASLLFNCQRICRYIDKNFSRLGIESEYAALCQLMKWPFLLDGKYDSYRRWHEWFPESNKLIWQTKGVNKRIKFIEWSAAMHLWPIVWMHYIMVIKLYYGIVYGK